MKKIIPAIIALFIPLLFSCMPPKSMAKSPSELTEKEIVEKNTYSRSTYLSKSINNKSTITVRHFSGVEKTDTFSSKNDKITITLSCKLEEGELRLCLCDSESIIHEFDVAGDQQTFTIPADGNRYFLKTAGKDAKFKLEYSLEKKKIPISTAEEEVIL